MDIHVNGRMLPPADAKIGVEDAGFQHAVGLFETMTVHHGRPFRLDAHLARIDGSARELGLARQLDASRLADAVTQTIAHNKLDTARLRLTVTAGAISLLRDTPQTPPEPTVVVVAQPLTTYDPRYFEEGITIVIAPPGANPFDQLAGHKTLSYWGRLRTLRQAAAAGAGEAIWLNVSNHLASGAVSNVFLVKGGTLFTPIARGEEVEGSLPAPVLPGVTRATVIEAAEKLGMTVRRRMLSVKELLDADEVFLTNSGWRVLPVSRVEKKAIGTGKAGEITKRLRSAVLERIERETTGVTDEPRP